MFETSETNQATTSETNEAVNEVSQESQHETESLLNADSGESLEQVAEENDDIEVDGKKYVLPKSAAEKLKSERMMHGDYTQKTQAVAEERKAVAAEREYVQKQAKEHREYIQDYAKVVAFDNQLAQYAALDWNALIAQDPVQAMQYQQQQKTIEGQRNQAAQAVMQKQQQHALNEQQEYAKQLQDADAYFKREISGWSVERSDQLMNYGVTQGLQPEALSRFTLMNPAFAKVLHKANLYDQIAKKQTPATTPTPQAKPVPKVGQNASAKKDPSTMSHKEFAEYRRKIIAKR